MPVFLISFTTGGNGGMIATMTLMLTQIGLPLEAIGSMTITDIFVVNVSGVISAIIRDCDLIDVSHRISFEGKSA